MVFCCSSCAVALLNPELIWATIFDLQACTKLVVTRVHLLIVKRYQDNSVIHVEIEESLTRIAVEEWSSNLVCEGE